MVKNLHWSFFLFYSRVQNLSSFYFTVYFLMSKNCPTIQLLEYISWFPCFPTFVVYFSWLLQEPYLGSNNLIMVYFAVYFRSRNLSSVFFTVFFRSKNHTLVFCRVGSFSVSPNIDPTIPSSVCIEELYKGLVRFDGNERNPSLLVRDDQRMTLYGKALGVGWWMESLGEVPRLKPLGPAGLGLP